MSPVTDRLSKSSDTPASLRYAAIKRALSAGNPDLADAIDNDERCPDCGGYVAGGFTVDPDKCCWRCEP